MLKFTDLNNAVAKQFKKMSAAGLYLVGPARGAGTDDTNYEELLAKFRQELWDAYLASFPAGSNPMYRKRTEHDCSCCRSFVKTLGGVVSIIDGGVATIWDVQVEGAYQVVADAMAAHVRESIVNDEFLYHERTVGTLLTRELVDEKLVNTWNHFFVNLPDGAIAAKKDIGKRLSDIRSTKDVFLRSLKEITSEAVDIVLDLIDQNSLYRGEQNRFAVDAFRKLQREFSKQRGDAKQALFCWTRLKTVPESVSKIRGTAIGTLLVNISENMDIAIAVKAFEKMVAPANYQHPSAPVTKAMLANARAKFMELGYESALGRRFANLDDITINNLIYADRDTKKAMNVFDELAARVPEKLKHLDNVAVMGIKDFIKNVVPNSSSIELFVENPHAPHFVSLIAPEDPTAKIIMNYGNNYSISYAGGVADAIKERVKAAGGSVDGYFRASLSWFNFDDLDLHLKEPSGNLIFYRSKINTKTGGNLDVDMNAGAGYKRDAVENITFPKREKMEEGDYVLSVHNFCQREKTDVGFVVEVECEGKVYTFSHDKQVGNQLFVCVAKFRYNRKTGIEIIESIPSTATSRVVWGIPSQTFVKVSAICMSPNFWDERDETGNKHYLFMLDGCINDTRARGIQNEFLTKELHPHRKVCELLGSTMVVPHSDRQLSGLGFSSTMKNQVLARVKGSFSRTIKIVF